MREQEQWKARTRDMDQSRWTVPGRTQAQNRQRVGADSEPMPGIGQAARETRRWVERSVGQFLQRELVSIP